MDRNERINEYLKIFGFKSLTEVQEKVLESALNRRNLVVQSVTGTGKTHSYLFPIFLSIDKNIHDLQVVISSPTRELARQIYEMAKPLAAFEGIDVKLYVGGDDIEKSKKRLEKNGNPQIAIGTPGRLKMLSVDLSLLNIFKANTFIIDEADMTMDQGFIPLIDQMLVTLKDETNIMVFSATIPESIEPFLKKYLENPTFIEINKKDLTPLNITHYFIKTKYRDKVSIIKDIMSAINPYLSIIYCNTKDTVIDLYNSLKNDKRVTYLYGDMEPTKRRKTMKDIRDLKYTYIISTDLTSRGLDISGVSHIINYELPKDEEFYVHRTGRTGRMFNEGLSISLYDLDDDSYLDKLESKGLKTEYVEIKDNKIVPSKIRNARSRMDFYKSKINQEAEKQLRHKRTISKKVKPNYKKNFNKKVQEEKKIIIKQKLKNQHKSK
ncbi:DEAD/DEAH box helicase [bacterium]|nr:DEAD/DEAH box helicase [bacterium]